ncbi:unnamed protein product [Owenia fusiformis]|uniref:G-protein coupled receptors family 1 profile domain-containing protein n=1 Tax=Owenia fusiformis TaxID=6347 RepID=A0A8S4NYP8_OWEFU|nr:unnamed protein product [Owenia fusiformis]
MNVSDPSYNLVDQRIWNICTPIVLVFGTIGNVLSIVVFGSKKMRSKTMSLYLISLAVVDILALWFGLFTKWVPHIETTPPITVRALNGFSCKLITFMVYTNGHVTSWILVFVTYERFISVFFPLKAKALFKIKSTLIIIAMLFTVFISLNLHIFWMVDVIENNITNERDCRYTEDHKEYWTKRRGFIDLILGSFIPFILMLIASIAIISKLATRKIGAMNNKNIAAMTITLLLCNFFFMLTTAPIVLFLVLNNSWYPQQGEIGHPDYYAYQIHYTICDMIFYINHSANFVLYCISGPIFRKQIKSMFMQMKCFGRNNKVGGKSMTNGDSTQVGNSSST